MTKSGWYTTMFIAKCSIMTMLNLQKRLPHHHHNQKYEFHERKLKFGMGWEHRAIIYLMLLVRNETINARLYIQQLQYIHISLFEKLLGSINNNMPLKARIIQENNLELGWSVLTPPTIFKWPCSSRNIYLLQSLQKLLRRGAFSNGNRIQEFV